MPFWSITIAFGTFKFIKFFEKNAKIKLLATAIVIVLSFYVSYKTYTVNIRSVMASQTTTNLAKISSYLHGISEEDDQVARLDHLYPTTIYYTDRFVYCSDQSAGTDGFFLRREDLFKKISRGEIKWVTGKNTEIEQFLQKLPEGKGQVIATEGDEQLVRLE
jgi:hypothetical protein